MMRATRRASLLLAFYLLTSAATAYAACAWVLWSASDDPGTNKRVWHMTAGFPSNKMFGADRSLEIDMGWKACIDQRDQMLQNAPPGIKNPFAACLPDTVDPRVPKGK